MNVPYEGKTEHNRISEGMTNVGNMGRPKEYVEKRKSIY
jgi:hypothetical protein